MHRCHTIVLLLALLLCGPRLSAQQPPAPAPATPAATRDDDTYKLNLQDKLIFAIAEDPIQTAVPDELYVNALGEVHFRISRGFDDIITLPAKGRTLSQIKNDLKAILESNYYHRATIELRLTEQTRKNGQVLFFGAVRGNFMPLTPNEPRTIFEGVYQVGVTEFANLKKVKLSRLNPNTGKVEARIVDLEAIKKGDRQQDVPLQDGDRIEVPEKKIVF